MKLFNPHTDLSALRTRLTEDHGLRVVCYCAAWCRTCDTYRPALETLAGQLPHWTFIWVDIEDSPGWLGDEDIENFPTVLVQDRVGTRFWGVQLPYVEHLQRLLEGAEHLPVTADGPGQVDQLVQT
ncbi:thioredoxin family protein [Castellaniella sp.]|uniref:thioredoxin family protein n=1 Tax=Castellaniella sp. TaxID=1955812 RepID=UPI002AFE1A5A|nr:thioredoxin family protein [Castellaniella sp.]